MTIQLIKGDCREYLERMDAASVDLVLTDPPYDLNSHTQLSYLALLKRISRGTVILFCSPENQWPVSPNQYLFWVKPISTKNTSRKYSRFVEMILIYGEGKWVTGRHWSQYTNVFQDLVEEQNHAFEKPLSLIKRLVLNHTESGDTVLDPFMGSGSVGKVCAATGRNYIGIEQSHDTFIVAQTCLAREMV